MYPCQVPCPTGEFNERDCQGPGSNETNSFFLHTNLVLLMIDLRHLRTVHALRETDSLHEAAERLHLTQSAFLPPFRELEEHIGVQLFAAIAATCWRCLMSATSF